MSPLDAARALAPLTPDGERELNDLLVKSFILPKLEAISSLDMARRSFQALGAAQFHAYAMRIGDPKIRKMLEAVGCPKGSVKSLTDVELRNLLREFASGTRDTYAAPESARTKTTTAKTRAPKGTASKAAAPKPPAAKAVEPKAAAPLPDVRALYRSGGTEALYKAIKTLKAAELRAVIAEQKIKVASKANKDDMLKHIQTAVRDELGVRGDWIGAVARRREDDEA